MNKVTKHSTYFLNFSPKYSIHLESCAKSSTQILAAAPIPTHRDGDNVPLLSPLSCPPPENNGSRRTLGLLRTYNAPTPLGP